MNGLLLLGGLFVVAYGSLLLIALRRPLFARIAIREATRRPLQSALVVAGLMIGSGAILVSEAIQNSTDDSLTAAMFQSWGRVDLTVSAPGNGYFDPTVAKMLATDPRVRPSAAGVQAAVELVASVADLDRRSSNDFVRLIGFDPATEAAFGQFRLVDGRVTSGENLQGGQVFIGQSLATTTGAKVGDHVRIAIGQADGEPKTGGVTVAGVVAPVGPGSYGLRPAIFAPLATVAGLIGTPQVNMIRIAAPGNGQGELDAGHRLAPIVAAALTRLPVSQLQVHEPKADDITAARHRQDPGNANSGFESVLGSIVLLAGLVLVVNLMATLVEERRPRLAVLRALGLSRLGLIAALSMEGALYSLVAAVLGLVPGVLVSWALVAGTLQGKGGVGAGGGIAVGRDLQVGLSVRSSAVALAIAAGAVVTLGAVILAAVLRSDMTIAAAIRDLPEPVSVGRGSRSARLRHLGLAVGSLIAVFNPLPLAPSTLIQATSLRLLGGAGLIAFVAIWVRGRIPDRPRLTATGLALAVWALTSFWTTNGGSSPVDIFLAVLVTALGLSLAVVSNLRQLESAASAVGDASGRLRATLRPALAYLTRRPLRAGVTIGTFAMLLSVIVIYNVLISDFADQSRQSRARLSDDISVFMPAERAIVLPPAVEAELIKSVSIATRTYLGPVQVSSPVGTPAIWHQEHLSLYELTPDQLRNPPVGSAMTNRLPQFPNDVAAWRAVENDAGWVFWTRFNTDVRLTLMGSNGPVTRTVAGDVGDPLLDGIIGSPAALAPFGNLPLGTTVLVTTRPGVDSHAVAAQIRQALLPSGAEVTAISDLLRQRDAAFELFASVPILFMRMGMVIGILSLGILALRAVVERRRAIGVLRALGYRRGDMVAGIMTEATLTTSCGALIGVVTGVVVAVIYIQQTIAAKSPLALDVRSLAGTLALMFAAVLLATLGPALAAARTPPAQALRLQE